MGGGWGDGDLARPGTLMLNDDPPSQDEDEMEVRAFGSCVDVCVCVVCATHVLHFLRGI